MKRKFCSIVFSLIMAFVLTNFAISADYQYNYVSTDGFMKSWLILGPIPISDDPKPSDDAIKQALDKDYLIDNGGESGIQPSPNMTVKIEGQEYKWQVVNSDSDIIDLEKIFGKKEYVTAYAWAEIDMPEAKTTSLAIGSDDSVKIWLNGTLVHKKQIGRAVNKDDDIVPVSLNKGKNSLLFKVQNQQMSWGFVCREADEIAVAKMLAGIISEGDPDKIKDVVFKGVNVNAKDEIGLTALHIAKIIGRKDAEQYLLENGADPNIPMPSTDKIADGFFEKGIKGDSAGAAVLVAKDGKIVYQKAFGFADIENHVPVTTDTIFRIGSITKQFTSSAILKLQEEGKLSVNDHLSKFIPDFPRGDEVTIHHLLTHTSGIHSFTSEVEFFKVVDEQVTPQAMIDWLKTMNYDFDPGEKWLYNNSGYFILGYIVEKVSVQPFGDYLEATFFGPLGMKHTGIHSWDLDLENEAIGYSYQNDKFEVAKKWDMSRAGGAGAIYSTIGDLHLWNEAIFNGKALSKESLDMAFTPAKLDDGSVANAFGAKYGYGWMFSDLRGLNEIGHSGGFDGFNAQLTRYPDQKMTIAVLTNCLPPPLKDSEALVASSAARAIAHIYLWDQLNPLESKVEDKSVDTSIYNDYVGRYDYSPYAGVLEITNEDGHLYAKMAAQSRAEIFPSSENEFFWKVADAKLTFIRDDQGNVKEAKISQGGNELVGPKLAEEAVVEIDPKILGDYVGEYDFGRAILTITKEDDKLFAQMEGQPKFEIFPRSENEFYWKIVNASITFVRNESGKVIKADYTQGDIKMEVNKIK